MWIKYFSSLKTSLEFFLIVCCGISSYLALHELLPQAEVPLLEASTRSAPVSVHTRQSLLCFWSFLTSQVDWQHDRLVVSKHFLHLLQKQKKKKQSSIFLFLLFLMIKTNSSFLCLVLNLTFSSLALASISSIQAAGSGSWRRSSSGITFFNQEVMLSRSHLSCWGSSELSRSLHLDRALSNSQRSITPKSTRTSLNVNICWRCSSSQK